MNETAGKTETRMGLGRRAFSLALILLTIILLVDPGDRVLHLKVPCFLLVMLIWLVRVNFKKPVGNLRIFAAIFILGVVIPGFWAAMSYFLGRSTDADNLLSFPKAFLFLTLLLAVSSEQIWLDRITARASVLIALITIAVAAISIRAPELLVPIYLYASTHQLAIINETRDQYGIGVGQFFYNSSPIMLIGLSYFFHRWLFGHPRRIVSAVLTVVLLMALVFTGARGNLIAAFFVLTALSAARLAKSYGRMIAVVIVGAMLLLPFAFFAARLFNPTEESNQIKLAHYQSYADLFGEHPIYLLVGQGEGTRFYSKGFGDYAYITELTYLELIRQFGIPVAALLCLMLVWPLVILIRRASLADEVGFVIVGYAAYLLVSASNELLVSSTGMLVVVMIWARAIETVAPTRFQHPLKPIPAGHP